MAKEIDNDQLKQIVAENVGPGDLSSRIARLRGKFGKGFFDLLNQNSANGLELLGRRLGVSLKNPFADFYSDIRSPNGALNISRKLVSAVQLEQKDVVGNLLSRRVSGVRFAVIGLGAVGANTAPIYGLFPPEDVLFVTAAPTLTPPFTGRSMFLNSSARTIQNKIAPTYDTTPNGPSGFGTLELGTFNRSLWQTRQVSCKDDTSRIYLPGTALGFVNQLNFGMHAQNILTGYRANITEIAKTGKDNELVLQPTFDGGEKLTIRAEKIIATPGLDFESMPSMDVYLTTDRFAFESRIRESWDFYKLALTATALLKVGDMDGFVKLNDKLSKLRESLDFRLPKVSTWSDLSEAIIAWKYISQDPDKHPLADFYRKKGDSSKNALVVGFGDGGTSFIELLNRQGDQSAIYPEDQGELINLDWWGVPGELITSSSGIEKINLRKFNNTVRPRYKVERGAFKRIFPSSQRVDFLSLGISEKVVARSDDGKFYEYDQVFLSLGIRGSLVQRAGPGEMVFDSDGYRVGRRYGDNGRLVTLGPGNDFKLPDFSSETQNILRALGATAETNTVALWAHAPLAIRYALDALEENIDLIGRS